MLTIAVDAMGGDVGPKVTVAASIRAVKKHANVKIILVGQPNEIAKSLKPSVAKKYVDQIEVHAATEVVAMDESPALALKKKKDSSMRVSIDLVKTGKADAAVSAWNTGALMATAKFVLKTIDGVQRPAICAMMPTKKGTPVFALDLGANVDCTPVQLQQFAVMGSAVAEAITERQPKVGLLNVGSEAIKGNEVVKATDKLLQNTKINYIGYVEGDDVLNGDFDVLVCDGFVGNVMLKSIEGTAKMISSELKDVFQSSIMGKLGTLFASAPLMKMKKKMDPNRYNGANFVGLNGLVLKSHGGTNKRGFLAAIETAIAEIEHDALGHIKQDVAAQLTQAEAA